MDKHAPNGPNFFPFGGKVKGCWIFCCSQCVPIKFHFVLQMFPPSSNVFSQYAPNMITLYPMSSALTSSIIATYITSLKAQDNKISIWDCTKLN
jgi:hypothetical protein